MLRRVYHPANLLLSALCCVLTAAPAGADSNAAGRSAAAIVETFIQFLVSPAGPPPAPHRSRPPVPSHAPARATPPLPASVSDVVPRSLPVPGAAEPVPERGRAIVTARRSTASRRDDAGSAGLVLETGVAPQVRCNPALVVCAR
jgi:hypothetical protein